MTDGKGRMTSGEGRKAGGSGAGGRRVRGKAGDGPLPRIVLVECINADQFPGQINGMYPFVKGWLDFHGVASVWIRYGISTDNQYRHGRDEVTLADDELERLADGIARIGADLVLTTHPLYAGQVRRLRARFRGLRVAQWGSACPEILALMDRLEPGRACGSFRCGDVLDNPSIRMDYRWEAGNESARRPDRNNIYLFLTGSCGYKRPVSLNPLYAGLDLPEDVRSLGCSFCGHLARHTDPIAATDDIARTWISRQLRDIRDSLAPDRLPGAVILESIERATYLDHVTRELRDLGMTGTAVLFGCRVDQLLRTQAVLERMLPELEGGRGSMHLFTIGIENLSDAELLRLHKGFDALSIFRAVNLLKELEVRYPDCFHYSGYMPLSVILFSPWTTFEDLQINLRLIQHFDLELETGNFFMARLRLHDDLAITALAARDGVIVESVESALLLNRRKLFRPERAWRFLDPRLHPVNRIATRLSRDDSFAGDDLYARIQARLAAHAPAGAGAWTRRRLMAVLLDVIDAAERSDEVSDEDALLDRALETWSRREQGARERPARPRTYRLGHRRLSPGDYLEAVAPRIGPDGIPVLSLPGLSDRDLGGLDRGALERLGLVADVTGTGDDKTLHLARDPAALRRLVGLAPALAGRDDAGAAAREEAARLRGLPDCCARAWAADPWSPIGTTGWTLAARRGDAPGAPWPLLAPGIAFVPCTPDCAEASQRHRAWLDGLCDAGADRLWLYPLDGGADRDLASCRVVARDGSTVVYDPGTVEGDDGPLADALRKGDRVECRPGRVEVRSGDRPVARWVAEVGAWDPQRAADGATWQELARAALRRADPEWQRKAKVSARRAQRLALDQQTARGRFESGSEETPGDSGTASGDRKRDLFSRRGSRLVVFADRTAAVDDFTFCLGPCEADERVFLRVGNIGLVYRPHPDADLFRRFAALLDASVRELARAGDSPDPAAWERSLRSRLQASGLADRFECLVRQV